MRRVFAVGLCAWYVAFGCVAGMAHVHRSADHHEEPRGLHLDHAHLDHPHEHGRGERHATRDEPAAHTDERHVGHHAGDAVHTVLWATRTLPTARALPGTVSAGPAVERSAETSESVEDDPSRPRDPPQKVPPRLRAPPA